MPDDEPSAPGSQTQERSPAVAVQTPPAPPSAAEPDGPVVWFAFVRRNVWAVAWTVVAVVVLTQLMAFVLHDGGSVLFVILMSWIASVAMEPAVSRLALRMKRNRATLVVMVGVLAFCALFIVAFGRLLADQIIAFVAELPQLAQSLTDWANSKLGSDLKPNALLESLDLTSSTTSNVALGLAGGLLGLVVSILSAVFSVFTFAFFTYYLSADAPRLRRWLARLFPPAQQDVVATVWDLAIAKGGGYVAARLVLAFICGSLTSVFLLIIGMPYWLALGIWTGLVAQFVPTIGTYIAIALPVIIGLLGDKPIQGVLALVFAVVYQQIENLFIEPRISAKAVDVHPAASFGAVMLGGALYGVAGAFVAVPVAALLLALMEIYARKYELLPRLQQGAVVNTLPSSLTTEVMKRFTRTRPGKQTQP